jgi:two-component system response regulator HupR/HoxA
MLALVEEGEFVTVRHLSAEVAESRPQLGRLLGLEREPEGATLKQRVEHLEAVLVRDSLRRHNWNHSRASRELGLSRVGLANKIKRYRLEREPSLVAADGR